MDLSVSIQFPVQCVTAFNRGKFCLNNNADSQEYGQHCSC